MIFRQEPMANRGGCHAKRRPTKSSDFVLQGAHAPRHDIELVAGPDLNHTTPPSSISVISVGSPEGLEEDTIVPFDRPLDLFEDVHKKKERRDIFC